MKPIYKTTLRRVHVNAQGYDTRGAYWGNGVALYWFAFHDHHSNLEHSDHLRAHTRDAAKEAIRLQFPTRDMRFYN